MPNDETDSDTAAGNRETSFLARWSRRKQAANRQHAAEVPDAEDAATEDTADAAATADEPVPTASDSEAGEEAEAGTVAAASEEDLPPPEQLPPDSDFTAYLSKRVSREVRRAALRKLFSSPKFNVRDGLDDYDEDYTQFQSLGQTVTAHMRHHAERLRERAEAEQETAPDEAAEAPEPRAQESGESAAADDDTPPTANPSTTADHSRVPDDNDTA